MQNTVVNEHDLITMLKEEGVELTRAQLYELLTKAQDLIIKTLKQGTEVRLNRFMSFTMTDRAARTARNPRTGEAIDVPAKRVVKLIPRKRLYELSEEIVQAEK